MLFTGRLMAEIGNGGAYTRKTSPTLQRGLPRFAISRRTRGVRTTLPMAARTHWPTRCAPPHALTAQRRGVA